MEEWQKDHITKNIHNLVEYTECNTALLAILQSVDIIDRSDIEQINGSNEPSVKSRKLYDILITRTFGYSFLMKALGECKQSGAHNILLKGVSLYATRNAKVKLSKHVRSIGELIGEDASSDLKIYLKQLGSINSESLIDIFLNAQSPDDPFLLSRDTIPKQLHKYIPRTLTKRAVLVREDLFHKCSHVFVFTGIDRTDLTKLAGESGTATSSSQLQNVTSRFILLEDDADWDEIRRKSEEPAHLIKHKSGAYFLTESSKESGIFQNIPQTGHSIPSTPVTTENQLIDSLATDSTITGSSSLETTGILVCETPGMGKSELLANLARQVASRNENLLVAYIPLAAFLNGIGNALPLFEKDPSQTMRFIVDYVTPDSDSIYAPDIISREILIKLLESRALQLVLLFDGFDEIPKEDIAWATTFLQKVQGLPNTKFVVAARPHMRNKLESTLGVKAYGILPFSKENQIDFLVRNWKNGLPSEHTESKIREFTESCIKHYDKTLLEQDKDILGIPLLCYLLVDVYKEDARIYSHPRRSTSSDKFAETASNVFAIYQRFMNLKFPTPLRFHSQDPAKIKVYHVWSAFSSLFPETSKQYTWLKPKLSPSLEELLSFGVLEARYAGDDVTSGFVHRTLAECLVAEYIADIILGRNGTRRMLLEYQKLMIKFFINQCLVAYNKGHHSISSRWYAPTEEQKGPTKPTQIYSFRYNMIAYFLNQHLSAIHDHTLEQVVADTIFVSLKPEVLYKLLICAIRKNYLHLLLFVQQVFTLASIETRQEHSAYFRESVEDFGPNVAVERCTVLLCIAAAYSSRKMVEQIFQVCASCFQVNLTDICRNMPLWMETPLHHAVSKGDYELVEFLRNKISLRYRCLLYYCQDCSYWDSPEMVISKMNICKLLLDNDANLHKDVSLHINGGSYGGTILVWGTHIKIIELLVSKGAYMGATMYGKTIVHRASEYMSATDFHQLCHLLIANGGGYLFTSKNSKYTYWSCPLHHILENCKSVLTETFHMILELPHINVNGLDKAGNNNLVLSAIHKNKTLPLIKLLIKHGADIKFKNKMGRSAIHLAAEGKGNHPLVKYLLTLDFDSNDRDAEGNTPLLLATQNVEVIKLLISHGADIRDTDNKSSTILHTSAWWLSQKDYHDLLLFITEKQNTADVLAIQNDYGEYPLHIRMKSRRPTSPESIAMLLGNGRVKINAQDADGFPPFLSAVKGSQPVEVLQALIRHGADASAATRDQQYALQLAKSGRNTETIR